MEFQKQWIDCDFWIKKNLYLCCIRACIEFDLTIGWNNFIRNIWMRLKHNRVLIQNKKKGSSQWLIKITNVIDIQIESF